MLFRPWYSLYSLIAAVVGGILLARGSYVGGAILVVVAIAVSVGKYIVERRREDDTFTIW